MISMQRCMPGIRRLKKLAKRIKKMKTDLKRLRRGASDDVEIGAHVRTRGNLLGSTSSSKLVSKLVRFVVMDPTHRCNWLLTNLHLR
jgi:hypothetical protein